MIRYAIVTIAVLVLTGCVSSDEQAAIDRADDENRCQSFGFKPGTERYSNCLMTQSAQRADLRQRQEIADERRTSEQWEREAEDRRAAQRDRDSDIDPRPQFDSQGNPNFDEQGNYQGCHGIGCEVDTPDDGGSDDD